MMCKFAEKNQREQSGSVHHLEAGKELSELREERQEDKADEVGLWRWFGHLVSVHEWGHRQPLEFFCVALNATVKIEFFSVDVCEKSCEH